MAITKGCFKRLVVIATILSSLIQTSFCWQPSISPTSTSRNANTAAFDPSSTTPSGILGRRNFIIATSTVSIAWQSTQNAALARAPGSKSVSEAIPQIQGAANDLRKLLTNWESFATIDAEGRAGSTDAARRILGGIAPMSGKAAIEVAQATPLYRIDGAFGAIRQAAIEDDPEWAASLDLIRYEELTERVLFAIQKADGDFYSVLFASKGTKQVTSIFAGAKGQIKQGIADLEEILKLLKDAGAPL